ncbi:hypothetical protein [Gallaecimonas mangrovi]|uniref:hypothetical protein n=1 Tax=Gallaecimonas mangrovi TaxID=2291597 RepID=UPI000E1FDA82|nr:hypothetical protein [Gallaecimonas mangrovi]
MLIPENYQQWRHCITVECGITLTPAYLAERLTVWRSANCEETLRFRRRYGDNHWRSVLAWFEQAQKEIGQHA